VGGRHGPLALMDPANNFTSGGGGGIYIEFTQCTPGLTNCSSNENTRQSGSVPFKS